MRRPSLADALASLQGFIHGAQMRCMVDGCRGEEGPFFREKLAEYAARVETMPKTYEQEGIDDPVAHLHYFVGAADWYITERDIDDDGVGQMQAFGLADLGYGPELGYICLPELLAAGAELDLHWTPAPLSVVRSERA